MAEKDKAKKGSDDSASTKQKSGGMLKTVLMIGVPVIILQTGLAYFLISKFVKTPRSTVETQNQDDSTESLPDSFGKMHVIADVIINPAGTAGSRFLNATVALECGSSGVEAELLEKDVQIRDALISILVSKTIQELDGPDDKEKLRQEILDKCNSLLRKGKIRRVFFTNFVMQ